MNIRRLLAILPIKIGYILFLFAMMGCSVFNASEFDASGFYASGSVPDNKALSQSTIPVDSEKSEIEILREEIREARSELKGHLREIVIEEVLPEIWLMEKRVNDGSKSSDSTKVSKPSKDKIRLGRVEWIKFKDPEFELQARIDTGAKTCSIHAENIKELQINGEPYVQFETVDQQEKRHTIVRRVVSRTKVKDTSGRVSVRYVIRSTIKLGNTLHDVNVNLNDRTRLNYNFLVGRNLLMGNYLVDVSESHLLGDKL
ncbi:MAG TPA: RimK/LysX family protein [Oligoflexia bacterium]|nr:RimK/LysX family protein [Oligoflexia bacterium]HMP49843.1 RimK/LysX family protein [Oligoflexia bacterium]